jgi:hypothetical protein
MIDPAARISNRQRTRVTWVIAAVVGTAVVSVSGLMLYLVFHERDQIYWSRLYLAKSEITALAGAAQSFHKAHGRYPTDLQELVRATADSDGGGPSRGRVPNDPWGGQFHYEVGADTKNFKIWVIPDRKTELAIGVNELSNRTNWEAILNR